MTENEISREVVDVAFKIHTAYGPGLLESVYETIMSHELKKNAVCVWFDNKQYQLFMKTFEWNSDFVRI